MVLGRSAGRGRYPVQGQLRTAVSLHGGRRGSGRGGRVLPESRACRRAAPRRPAACAVGRRRGGPGDPQAVRGRLGWLADRARRAGRVRARERVEDGDERGWRALQVRPRLSLRLHSPRIRHLPRRGPVAGRPDGSRQHGLPGTAVRKGRHRRRPGGRRIRRVLLGRSDGGGRRGHGNPQGELRHLDNERPSRLPGHRVHRRSRLLPELLHRRSGSGGGGLAPAVRQVGGQSDDGDDRQPRLTPLPAGGLRRGGWADARFRRAPRPEHPRERRGGRTIDPAPDVRRRAVRRQRLPALVRRVRRRLLPVGRRRDHAVQQRGREEGSGTAKSEPPRSAPTTRPARW